MGKMSSHAHSAKKRESQCTHMTMTRLHSQKSQCSICHRDGSTVFIYQCTHDHEMILRDLVNRGEVQIAEHVESLWDSFFSRPFHLKKQGACYSLVSETILPGKACKRDVESKYCCDETHQILYPKKDQVFRDNTTTLHMSNNFEKKDGDDSRDNSVASNELWTSSSKDEQCKIKYCRNCCTGLEQRSYLELDSIVNGTNPLTSLVGHPEYERPVGLASIVINLGLRPNPKSQIPVHEGKITTDNSSAISCSKGENTVSVSATQRPSHLKSSRFYASVPTVSTARLSLEPNKRRVQRTPSKFIPITTPRTPHFVSNRICMANR